MNKCFKSSLVDYGLNNTVLGLENIYMLYMNSFPFGRLYVKSLTGGAMCWTFK